MNFSLREFLPASEEAAQKVAETTGDLIGNKFADKITGTSSEKVLQRLLY